MNWKRGLTRIYVLVWIAFAALGAYLSIDASRSIEEERRSVAAYLQDHREVTMSDLHRFVEHRAHPDSADDWIARNAKPLPPDEESQRLDGILAELQSSDYRHPAIAHAKIFGLWFLGYGLAPGVLLAVISWVVSGFRK